MTPIFKKDDPAEISNYRPISLLSTVGKVLEKIVHKHVFNFFQTNHAITLQSGLVPGDSTVDQLTDLYNTFCHALDEGKAVRVYYVILAKRLTEYGIRVCFTNSLLIVFLDHFSNSSQTI